MGIPVVLTSLGHHIWRKGQSFLANTICMIRVLDHRIGMWLSSQDWIFKMPEIYAAGK
jgi:hypothetical protein